MSIKNYPRSTDHLCQHRQDLGYSNYVIYKMKPRRFIASILKRVVRESTVMNKKFLEELLFRCVTALSELINKLKQTPLHKPTMTEVILYKCYPLYWSDIMNMAFINYKRTCFDAVWVWLLVLICGVTSVEPGQRDQPRNRR
jgi:hypothetical protein